jgi:hypothetical protein
MASLKSRFAPEIDGGGKGEANMTYVERMIVRRGHPKHIIIGIVAFLWAVYFLWQHNWIWAAAIVVLSAVLGRLSTSGTKEETLAQTLLGKIMLLHLHPVNLTLQMAGFALLLYGIWMHSTPYIMAATSMVFLGHMWGWHKVNEAL